MQHSVIDSFWAILLKFFHGCKPVIVKPEKIFNEKHEEITSVNHAMMKFYFQCNHKFPKNSIIRKKVN